MHHMGNDAISLLKDLLRVVHASPEGVRETRFRADHPDDQRLIDTLIWTARIERKQGNLFVRPLAIAELAPEDNIAAELHRRSGEVFEATRQHVRVHEDGNMLVNDLAAQLKIMRSDLVAVIVPLLDTGIWATYSTDLSAADAYLTPSVTTVLQYRTYDQLIEQLRAWASNHAAPLGVSGLAEAQVTSTRSSAQQSYVARERLDALRAVMSTKFDLRRLIRLCEELNAAHERELWMACAMLLRGIVDHVPPIFGCADFPAVASNHPGSKTFRQHMKRLDTSLREVANSHLHVQVRARESLPTAVQVDFRADVDVLLAEVVRIL